VLRTTVIALVVGLVLARWSGGRVSWLLGSLLMLWFSFGGHWVELCYLNWLSPRLSSARLIQIAARLAVWFVGGSALAVGMALTAKMLTGFSPHEWPLWLGGLAFVGLELVVHLLLMLRGRPSFYNGQG
jgi:hypothetical protein